MSNWLFRFRSSISARAADQLVRSVGDRSMEEIELRFGAELAEMGAAELRGYIRARAITVVRAHAQEIAAANALTAFQSEKLFRHALERVVQLAAKQHASRRPAAYYQVPLRIAG